MNIFDRELDTSACHPPSSIVKTERVLAAMNHGEVLKVIYSDHECAAQFRELSRRQQHAIISSIEAPGRYIYIARKNRIAGTRFQASGS